MVLGSFTGIRIGIGTVKGLSAPNNIDIIPISSLEGLAYNVNINKGYICSLIDAKNNQVYCGIFDKNYCLCTDYIANDIKNVLPMLSNYDDITFVGHGFDDTNIHARNIGLAAYNKYVQGIKFTSDSVSPEYLRPSQAERLRQ